MILITWINKQIKNYVLRNQKLSEDILAGINDKRARDKTKELLKLDSKNFKRRQWKHRPNGF